MTYFYEFFMGQLPVCEYTQRRSRAGPKQLVWEACAGTANDPTSVFLSLGSTLLPTDPGLGHMTDFEQCGVCKHGVSRGLFSWSYHVKGSSYPPGGTREMLGSLSGVSAILTEL